MTKRYHHNEIESSSRYPLWFKSTIILIGLTLFFVILSYGRFILVPVMFSAFFAMLLSPLVRRLEKLRIGKILSIVVALLLVFIFFSSILALISTQFVQFADRLPEVGKRLQELIAPALTFIDQTFGVSKDEISDLLDRGLNNLIGLGGQYATSLLGATTSTLTVMVLMPVFIFFMLYYQEMYRTFFRKVLEEKSSHYQIDKVLHRVQGVTYNYLMGLLAVMGILAVLNTVGLYLIGLDNALFFGVLAALLEIIPYIGITIGSLLPFLYALLFTDSLLTPFLVIALFSFIQFLEGNFITPYVVGTKVSINPFVAVIALIIGGELWGIAGMILFVPLVGILRVVFDQIEGLKPYGFLLGSRVNYNE